MIYQNGHLDDEKWNEMLEEEYHMFQGPCVCKVLVFKPLCFIISWWFCFSVIKYSSDLDTHTHTHTHVHTFTHIYIHLTIWKRATVPSTDHTACTLSVMVPRQPPPSCALVSITGRHGSATLQRELVCVTVRLWMCSEGKVTNRGKMSNSVFVWEPQDPQIPQICYYIIIYDEEEFVHAHKVKLKANRRIFLVF